MTRASRLTNFALAAAVTTGWVLGAFLAGSTVAPAASAQTLQHGHGITKGCVSPSKVGQNVDCLFTSTIDDEAGDSHMLLGVRDDVLSLDGGDICSGGVPCFIYDNPSDFTIVAISGNTLCEPTTAGQTAADILPCKVCSAGTAACPDTGDPGWNDAQPGSVQFSFTEYVLREIDAANSPLLDQAGVVWLDMCDSEASQLPNNNCNGVTENLTQGPSAIFVVAPAVTLDVACTDINQCHPEGEDPDPCVSTVSLTVSNPTGGAPVDPDLTATGCSFTSTFMGAEIYNSQTDGYAQYGFRECGTCSLDPAQVCFADSECSGGANTCDLVDSQNFCLEHGEEHTAMFETGEFDSTKSLSADVACDTGVVVNNSPDTDICQCETPVCSKTVCPDPDVVNLN